MFGGFKHHETVYGTKKFFEDLNQQKITEIHTNIGASSF